MRAVILLLLVTGAGFAQIENAADQASGISTTVLAPGSRAIVGSTILGIQASSATVSLLPVNSTSPLPAQVVSVGPSGVAFVVPPNMPLGPAQLIYKAGSQATQWAAVTIAPTALSLYRTGPGGQLVAQNVGPSGGYANGLAIPAQPGQGVQIWGSGLGATAQNDVHITLGGVPQQVVYVGSPAGEPGLNQINFLVAPGTPDGCYVPLTLTYGTQSVSGFISKTSDGMPCHHPWGLSKDAMQLLDRGTSIQAGEISLATGIEAASASQASRTESAQFQFTELNGAQIASYFAPATASAQTCSATSIYAGFGFSILGGFTDASLGAMTITNGASSLTLPWTSPAPADSPLSGLPPAAISGGNWTWKASGGSGFPSSSFAFALPPPIQLAGGAPIQIDPTQPATITWNGASYDSYASLALTLSGPGLPAVTCTVPAQAGSVTIPANLLTYFKPGAAGSVQVSVTEKGAGIPSADFVYQGSPLLTLVLWISSDARPVDFQ